MIMTKFESYLKERNIPIDSLEANSIQEGMQLAINEACQWLEDYLYEYAHASEFIGTLCRYVHKKDAIKEFRKYMEE